MSSKGVLDGLVLTANRVMTGVTLWGAAAGCAWAADPQPYVTQLAGSGQADLDAALKSSSDLLNLQATHAVGPFALAGRVRNDYDRLRSALESYGYYDGTVQISLHRAKEKDSVTVDGMSPALSDWLNSVPAGGKVIAEIKVQKGPLYHLGSVKVIDPKTNMPVALTQAQQQAFGLKTGQDAVAQDVLGSGGNLLDVWREEGHALARVDKPRAYLQPQTHTLDIVYPASAGPVLNIGTIDVDGLKRVHEKFVRRRLTVQEGELYQPSKIEAARQDLSSLGVFSNVGVKDGSTKPVNGTMPLDFTFKEAKRRSVGAEAGYSTDLGARVGATWTHYNILGNAERLKLTALITGLGGSAQQGLGYDVYADFMKPDFYSRNQNLSVRIEALRQLFWSYRQTAFLVNAGITRRIDKHWNVNFGLAAEQENIEQFNVSRDYTIVSAPLGATFDNTGVGNPIEPALHGVRASINATPSVSLGNKGSGTSFFAILNASASTYFDLKHLGISKPGRSIIALRAMIGSIQGASTYDIPPDQRMYAGGSATVRGYRWQGVGPQYGRTRYAIGGTSLDAGTIEYRQRLFKSFGMAGFVDAGQVGSGSMPFTGTLRVGAGGGVRYYTPIGPVRVDVAVPLNRAYRGDKWDLYIGLGETF
ncbi:outer membrane protein assembly factor [Acetobacter persici]|uniref:Outer membrane protein assembly factor n=2 Tax=Acetobacter persici TaxID=1076596 RepID=A0A6V8IAN5_9PROT|nr:membrane protein [Acetobacter persici]GFE92405.1 outer membrane protein assembly factor [Acetobacter persici]